MHDGSSWAVVLGVLVLLGIAIYLLPVSIAASRSHPNTLAIGALNILLGWTMLGWIAALVWALTSSGKQTVRPLSAASAGAATKSCPFCAEPVLVAAIKCKHCGSDLKDSTEQPVGPSHPDRTRDNALRAAKRGPRELAIGAVIGLLVIGGGAFGLSQFWNAMVESPRAEPSAASAPTVDEPTTVSQQDAASSQVPLPEPAAPISVTAFDLQRAYQTNTVAADDKYKGMRLLVAGTVKDINIDVTGAAYLVLVSGDEFTNPKATMASSERKTISKLRQGQPVTLLCLGAGDVLKSAMLEDCVFSGPATTTSEAQAIEAVASAASSQTSANPLPPLRQVAVPGAQAQLLGSEPANPNREAPLAERMAGDCGTGANALRRAFDRVLDRAQVGVHVARVVSVQNRRLYGCEVVFDMTDGNQVQGLFAADARTIHWTAGEAEPLAYEKLVMSWSLALSPNEEGQ